MFKFDLKNFYERVGLHCVRELKENIRSQKDIKNARFQIIKPSTARARASKLGAQTTRAKIGNRGIVAKTGKVRKSIAKSVPITRLFFTERFWLRAFKYKAQKDELKVFVNEGNYPVRKGETPIKYTDIVNYNNADSGKTNTNIKNPPLIFPNTGTEVKLMKSWKFAKDEFRQSAESGEIRKVIEAQGLKIKAMELNIVI